MNATRKNWPGKQNPFCFLCKKFMRAACCAPRNQYTCRSFFQNQAVNVHVEQKDTFIQRQNTCGMFSFSCQSRISQNLSELHIKQPRFCPGPKGLPPGMSKETLPGQRICAAFQALAEGRSQPTIATKFVLFFFLPTKLLSSQELSSTFMACIGTLEVKYFALEPPGLVPP